MNESTGDSPPLNPYAPTAHTEAGLYRPSLGDSAGISHARVIFSVIAAVAGAGGLFILVVGVIAAGAMLIAEPQLPDITWLWIIGGMMLYVFFGMLAVGAVAGIIVPLSAAVFGGFDLFGSRHWDRRSIRNFGMLCGFSTGWFCLIALTGFASMGAAIGLIPGGFGAFVTPILLRRLLRRADAISEHT